MSLPALIAEIEKLEHFNAKKTVLSKLKSVAALLAQAKIELTAPEVETPKPEAKPATTRVAANSMGKTKKPETMPTGG